MTYEVKVRLIAGREVKQLLNVKDVLETVESIFFSMGNGTVHHPMKEAMWLNKDKTNMLLAMPAYWEEPKIAGMKWVNMFKEQQPEYPSVGGTLLILNSAENGQPYAIIEASKITSMRSAGGHGAIATKFLAKKDSKILTFIGCGEQAKAGVDALLELFELKQIRVYSRNTKAMESFKEYVGSRAEVIITEHPQKAVENSDIVMMVTTSREPIVMFEWLPKGCTVIGLYSFYDLDPSSSRKSDKWVLGSKDTDIHQIVYDPLLKKYNLSMGDVYGDLSEIVTGRLASRENDNEIIVYTCLGMGALDIAVGQIVYERAVESNFGTIIDLT